MFLFRLLLCLLVGFFLGLTNLYLALRLGFVYGVAILAAFTWAGLTAVLRRLPGGQPLSMADTACYLSLASAMSFGCGTVIATSLSALLMSQEAHPSPLLLTLWVAAICGLGTCLALPLRQRLLTRLPFPSGQVASATVQRLAHDQPGLKPFWWGLAGVWLWVGLRDLAQVIPQRLFARTEVIFLHASPMMLGLGALLGPQVCIGMLTGATFFFVIVPAQGGQAAVNAVPWFAVGVLVSAGLLDFTQSLRGLSKDTGGPTTSRKHWPVTAACALFLGVVHLLAFGFSWAHLLILVLAAWPFALIACRITGETDVVPTGALGKLALLCFGILRPAETGSLLAATGVLTGASASSADFMTDLRCGGDLGCPPRRQFRYQLAGALLGPLLFVPVLFHLIVDHPLGGDMFPAPAAQIWLEVAHMMVDGSGGNGTVFGAGLLFGAVVFAVKHRFPRFPGAVPFAMAAFLDWGTTATLALGALLPRLIPVLRNHALCCALIAAESVAVLLLLL